MHANAIPTDFLALDVARKLGIERRDDRGMLTVSVKAKGDDPPPDDVEAEVRTTATTEHQRQTINMEALRDDGVTYYRHLSDPPTPASDLRRTGRANHGRADL